MNWRVELADEFVPEYRNLPTSIRRTILATANILREHGPLLGRPYVDTLNGSRHANMKEMRLSTAQGEWRIAFAFDPSRNAILLVGGDKSGRPSRRFYRDLIRKADERFDRHLDRLTTKGPR